MWWDGNVTGAPGDAKSLSHLQAVRNGLHITARLQWEPTTETHCHEGCWSRAVSQCWDSGLFLLVSPQQGQFFLNIKSDKNQPIKQKNPKPPNVARVENDPAEIV